MILKIENIKGGYRKGADVLNGVSLTINKGETLAVIGQNGAGKSTLAKAIVNALPIRTGNVLWKSLDITNKSTEDITKQGIGYFFQGGRVFPHLSIAENLKVAGHLLSRKQLEQNISDLKKIFPVLVKYLGTKQASELSGGEKHQLALCMVMLNKPQLLILDEPSAGLSPLNTQLLYEQLKTLQSTFELTILLIEQNVHEAINHCNSLIILSSGEIAKTFSREELNKKSSSKAFLFEDLVFLG